MPDDTSDTVYKGVTIRRQGWPRVITDDGVEQHTFLRERQAIAYIDAIIPTEPPPEQPAAPGGGGVGEGGEESGDGGAAPEQLPQPAMEESPFPIGPIDLISITSAPEHGGLLVVADDMSELREGDSITIEATGSTAVNGDYTATKVSNGGFVVENKAVAVSVDIQNRGRMTITGGAE